MANLESSALAKLQLQYTMSILKKTTYRDSAKPFLTSCLNAAPLLDNQFALNLVESENRTIEANRFSLPTSTSGTARETTHTGPTIDSVAEAITWTTYTEKMDWIAQQFRDNVMNGNDGMMLQIEKAIDKLMGRFETLGITFLEALKSGVNANNDQLGTWNATNSFFEVALADKLNAPFIGGDNMYQNNYMPMYNVIADNYTYALFKEVGAQGTGNSSNNGWQNFDEFDMLRSNGLTQGTYQGVSYWYVKDSLGFFHWIPQQNRRGEGMSVEDSEGQLGTIFDPRYPGVEFAVSIYTKRVDGSAINASTQAYRTYIEISLDGAFRNASLDVTNETVVQGLAILAA